MVGLIPDRVVTGLPDKRVGPSGRWIVDTGIRAPECPSYCVAGSAATVPLAAANAYYAAKVLKYSPHMKAGDVFLPVIAESWGALHPTVQALVTKWSQRGVAGRGDEEDPDPDTAASDVLSIWRMRLSVASFHGRVGLVSSALLKLRGVPAKSSTVAYSVAHPFRRAQELGRLGGRMGRS